MKDGAHTHHDHGPGGLSLAVSIAAGLVLARVIDSILPLLVILLGAAAGLIVFGLISQAVTIWRRLDEDALTSRVGYRPLQAAADDQTQMVTTGLTRTGVPAIHHQHLHLHGLDPGQVAAILAGLHAPAASPEDDAR